MQDKIPAKDRMLVWQITRDTECFACSECSWVLPNPEGLTEEEHDLSEVQRRFIGHVSSPHLPLKKFNWGGF
jgi:hypothetical protein